MLGRLFPSHVDNRFGGHRSALWLLGLLVALKLVVAVNSIFNTATVAQGADGIPLDGFGPAAAREVLTLFALVALGQLILALVALAALVRWRALVPFLYLVSLVEMLGRRMIVRMNDAAQPVASPIAWYVTWGVLILLIVGLALSLVPGRSPIGEKTS
ncbi:MAG TPA: hypothetical protein VF574_02255 [Allosphingosinicella sp.]|jgi:hypothetical protein